MAREAMSHNRDELEHSAEQYAFFALYWDEASKNAEKRAEELAYADVALRFRDLSTAFYRAAAVCP